MWENDDEKLKNIMKLRAEIEKDLKKRGLLRERKDEGKQSNVDEATMKRLKESVVSGAHISEEKSLTTYDINAQDYDASVENVVKTLRTFVSRTENMNRRLVFDGLVKMLSGDLRGAAQTFAQSPTIEARYNFILSRLLGGEDVTHEVAGFLKDYPDSVYPLLLILQVELYRGNVTGVGKVIGVLSKRSSFWDLVHALFTGEASDEQLGRATRDHAFSSLVVLLSVYVDRSREYPIQSHTCLNVHKALLRGETIQCPAWCVVGSLAMEARRYLSGYRIDLEKVRKFERTPEGALFLGFLFYNEKKFSMAEEYFSRFSSMVGTYDVHVGHLRHSRVGMEQFISIFDTRNLQKLPPGTTIAQALQENQGYDVFVCCNKIEFARLVFSDEFCSVLYR